MNLLEWRNVLIILAAIGTSTYVLAIALAYGTDLAALAIALGAKDAAAVAGIFGRAAMIKAKNGSAPQ